jgi:spore germination protein
MKKKTISKDLKQTMEQLEQRFTNCNDIVKKEFVLGMNNETENHPKVYMIYVDGLVNIELINESIIKPLLLCRPESNRDRQFHEYINHSILENQDTKLVDDMELSITEILSGNTMLYLDGCEVAICISSKKFPSRGIQEPDSELVMRGSKDAFTESLRFNTALIRRRIRDSKLKVEQLKIGQRSQTDIAILYMDDLVRGDVLYSLKKRLEEIRIDGVFDSGMMEHLLEKGKPSPFPQFQYTERPDKTASGIMEGRIAMVVDNSPGILILPVTLNCFFQAADDYYNHWLVGTFERMMRYVAALIAILVPALYVALMSYKAPLIPERFITIFTNVRQEVPFSIAWEILAMELAFELLREAGLRMPKQMGSTIGILGGLIVGQAAVEAGLVGTISVIVVALGAIASFAIPNESFVSTFRLLKFIMIVLAAWWGLYGIALGVLGLSVHLTSLESFGIPYLMPMVAGTVNDGNDYQDFFIRSPIRKMKNRPIFTNKQNQRRE